MTTVSRGELLKSTGSSQSPSEDEGGHSGDGDSAVGKMRAA